LYFNVFGGVSSAISICHSTSISPKYSSKLALFSSFMAIVGVVLGLMGLL
jgi:hypothetical protein